MSDALLAYTAIHWLDVHSVIDDEEAPERMAAVGSPLQVTFDRLPAGLRSRTHRGRTVVDTLYLDALPESLTLDGRVEASDRRYLPRRFSLALTPGEQGYIPLYRSPLGTAADGGRLVGSVRYRDGDDDGPPAAWARLELSVRITSERRLYYRAQADERGEFVMRLTGLPVLPPETRDYRAKLTAYAAPPTGDATEAPDPSELPECRVGSTRSFDRYYRTTTIAIKPGAVLRLMSKNRDHLSLAPL